MPVITVLDDNIDHPPMTSRSPTIALMPTATSARALLLPPHQSAHPLYGLIQC
ncbi:hypothetical protein BDQ12DRAFT_729963 [Crucibulum laeve]|uniref:Uncharacterized protein n=1 Tax=Crucibulum laeve TaxID=68775 RepID=A0A5C3LE57_9AGAR|nr:hypothetical protein BDQ12DRAFT_729963 [Crucibulum laeve]